MACSEAHSGAGMRIARTLLEREHLLRDGGQHLGQVRHSCELGISGALELRAMLTLCPGGGILAVKVLAELLDQRQELQFTVLQACHRSMGDRGLLEGTHAMRSSGRWRWPHAGCGRNPAGTAGCPTWRAAGVLEIVLRRTSACGGAKIMQRRAVGCE